MITISATAGTRILHGDIEVLEVVGLLANNHIVKPGGTPKYMG